jgi:hypothetical protein
MTTTWMTRLVLCTALMTLSASTALAQNWGIVSGGELQYTGLNTFQVNPGDMYINGVHRTPAAAAVTVVPATSTPNTPYYVYECYDHASHNLVPVLSTTLPLMDGEPIVPVLNNGDACDALFLGSVVTDSLGNLVPFVRNGDEVFIALRKDQPNGAPGSCTGTPSNWQFGAGKVGFNLPSTGGTTCETVSFDSTVGNNNSCNGVDDAGTPDPLELPVPRDASAMIVDFQLSTTTPGVSGVYIVGTSGAATNAGWNMPLYQYNMIVQPGQDYYYTQARIVVGWTASVLAGHLLYPPAPAQSATFTVCTASLADAGTPVAVTGYAYYRGYVEPIGRIDEQ